MRPKIQAVPRSMPLIFSLTMCLACVLNRPGSCCTWTAICSRRSLNTRTSRPSQRAQTRRDSDETVPPLCQRRHELSGILAPLGTPAVPGPGHSDHLGHGVGPMVGTGDFSEMVPDALL